MRDKGEDMFGTRLFTSSHLGASEHDASDTGLVSEKRSQNRKIMKFTSRRHRTDFFFLGIVEWEKERLFGS